MGCLLALALGILAFILGIGVFLVILVILSSIHYDPKTNKTFFRLTNPSHHMGF